MLLRLSSLRYISSLSIHIHRDIMHYCLLSNPLYYALMVSVVATKLKISYLKTNSYGTLIVTSLSSILMSLSILLSLLLSIIPLLALTKLLTFDLTSLSFDLTSLSFDLPSLSFDPVSLLLFLCHFTVG